MAKKIQIDIEVNGKMQKATVSAKKLRNALDDAAAAQERVNNGQRNYDRRSKGAAQATSNSTKEFSKMSQGMGGLVGAYATVAASVFALSAAFQFMQRVGDFSALTAGQEMMAARTGVSMKLLTSDIQEATAGMVAFKEAAQAAAIGQAAGLTSDQLTRLGAVAKNAGTILGRDVTDSFNRLTRGAIKAEPELLDELGIIVRIAEASENYGRVIGKNAKDLTTFEKSQAVVNAVLEQGESKFDDVGNSVNQVTILGAKFQDMLKGISDTIAPVVNFLAGSFASNVQALAAAFGLIGVSIIKGLIPAGPVVQQTEKDIARARRRIEKSADKGSVSGKAIRQRLKDGERLEKGHLRRLENAYKAKNSKVVNFSKITREQLRKDLMAIRLDTLKTTMDGEKGFKKMTTRWRIELMEFELEYGKTMGRVRGIASIIGRGISRLIGALSLAGLAVMVVQIGKDLRDKFFRNADIVEFEKKIKAITEATIETRDEVAEIEKSLKQARSPAEALSQQLGLMSNYNYSNLRALIKELKTIKLPDFTGQLPDVSERLRGAILGSDNQGIFTLGEADAELNKLKPVLKDMEAQFAESTKNMGAVQRTLYYEFSQTGVQLSIMRNKVDQLKMATTALNPQEVTDFFGSAEVERAKTGLGAYGEQLTTLQQNLKTAQTANIVGADQITGLEELRALMDETLANERDPEKFRANFNAINLVMQNNAKIMTDVNIRANAVNNSFNQLTNATEAFADASAKIEPPDSQFTAFYQAMNDANGAIDSLGKNLVGFDEGIQLGDYFNLEGEGKSSEQAKGILRIMKLLNVENEYDLTFQNLKTKLRERGRKIAEAEVALQKTKNDLAIAETDAVATTAAHEKDLVKATFASANASADLVAAEEQLRLQKLANVELSGEQEAALQREIDLARAKSNEAARLLGIEINNANNKKDLDAAQFDQKILGIQKQIRAEKEKQLKLDQQLFSLQKSMADKQLKIGVQGQRRGNPFFDDDEAMAQGQAANIRADVANRAAMIDREFNLRKQSINAEYQLLDAKRDIQVAQLKILAVELESLKDPTSAAQAADLRSAAADLATVDYSANKEAALALLDLQRGDKILDLALAVQEAEKLEDKFNKFVQLGELTASQFEQGLTQAIDTVFTSLYDKTIDLGEALRDIGRNVLSTIQKAITEMLIVDPLMDMISGALGKGRTTPETIEEAINNAVNSPSTGFKDQINAGAVSLKTEMESGAQTVKTKMVEALNNGVKVQCCESKPPSPPGPSPDETTGEMGSLESRTMKGINSAMRETELEEVRAAIPGQMDAVLANNQTPVDSTSMIKDVVATDGPKLELPEPTKGFFSKLFGKDGSLGKMFGNLFGEGGSLGKLFNSFKGGFSGIFDNLLGSFGSMFGDLFGSLGSLFGGGAGGGGLLSGLASMIPGIGPVLGGITGLFGFKNGGIMNNGSKVAGYATGGVADGPKQGHLAMLHGREAVVPLPNGNSIPVQMNGSEGMQNNNVTVNVSTDGQVQSSSNGAMGENLGQVIAAAVQKELHNQKRAGGILNKHGAA